MGIPDHLFCLLRNLYAGQEATVRTAGHQTMDWFKIGKGVRQGCTPSLSYLTYMQSISCEMPGWMKHRLESRLLGETATASDMQMTPPYVRKRRGTKEPPDEGEGGEWKSWLKTQHSKTKIMASHSITSWQTNGKIVEMVADFIFLGSKITADSDCSHEIKRHLLLGRKAMTNLDNVLKSRDITLLTKVRIVKTIVFPVVMYDCESWTIKKAEHWKTDAFELWCWRRLLRVPWTARRSNQSILKEIKSEYWMEELMLKLTLQYFGHLMWRAGPLEKTLLLGKIEGRRRWGWKG